MPFGLKNAAQTFQRLMDSMLQGVDFLFVYLDDILVASRSKEEHLSHLSSLFDHLSVHGLIINPAKSQFGLLSIDFLGHRITSAGVVPLPSRISKNSCEHNTVHLGVHFQSGSQILEGRCHKP